MKYFERLFERGLPHFGQLSTWLLCLFALILSAYPFEPEVGDRVSPSTVFGWLPSVVLASPLSLHIARFALALFAILWSIRVWIPWSAWATVVAFTLVWCLRMENTSHGAHIFNVTNMLLMVHAMWFHFERKRIKESIRDKRFWSTNLYPNWVFQLSIFYLCWFHMWAGVTKIQNSGLDWGNGLSLQLWVYLWGWPGSPTTKLLLSSRTLTQLLQTGALIFETSSILGIFSKWARWIVGFNLLGFYLGVLTTFVDYGFHANAVLVAFFMLPVREWMIRRYEKKGSPSQSD